MKTLFLTRIVRFHCSIVIYRVSRKFLSSSSWEFVCLSRDLMLLNKFYQILLLRRSDLCEKIFIMRINWPCFYFARKVFEQLKNSESFSSKVMAEKKFICRKTLFRNFSVRSAVKNFGAFRKKINVLLRTKKCQLCDLI